MCLKNNPNRKKLLPFKMKYDGHHLSLRQNCCSKDKDIKMNKSMYVNEPDVNEEKS